MALDFTSFLSIFFPGAGVTDRLGEAERLIEPINSFLILTFMLLYLLSSAFPS